MKKVTTDRALKFGVAIVACSSVLLHEKPLLAHPTDSPSAQVAARFKHNPPQNWIRHYMADDRYKVAGGIWKVVSTETDELFHRPDCPLMLQGDAETVIGFASSADAAEAGYHPDPRCRPHAPTPLATTSNVGPSVRRRNWPRASANALNGRRWVQPDGFNASVRALAASISRTSTARELQRLERQIERLKAGYLRQGDGDRALAVDWLLVAVRQKMAGPNPAGLSSWRNSLRLAQFAADEVARKATMPPAEVEREQERFNRRLREESLSAVKSAPSRR